MNSDPVTNYDTVRPDHKTVAKLRAVVSSAITNLYTENNIHGLV